MRIFVDVMVKKHRNKKKNRGNGRVWRKYALFGVVAILVVALAIGGRFAWIYYQTKTPKLKGNSYVERFDDKNPKHLAAATELGIEPIKDREAADKVKGQLVKVKDNEYYQIARLDYSIPYLTKGGKALLDSIGVNFRDSLRAKGMSEYKFVVSSVLRTEDDVKRLRASGNKNASKNSAHCYGTTFDINYNLYKKNWKKSVLKADQSVDSETLKAVLGEVLEDLKERKMCYVKYEVREPCFHITSRIE